jgi:Tol biopolymer transport system component
MGGSAGQVAFASEQTGLPQIWLVTDEGQLLRQITIADQGACQPAWSPNGKSLIFISPCDGNYDTYRGSGLFLIYDVDDPNSPSIPIMTEPGGDYDPAWSPDGTKIAFSSVRGTGSPRIFIMDLATRTVNQVSEQYKRSSQPAWSHDGKKIAYVSYEKGLNRIFMMNADGSEPQLITEAKLANDSFPSWSPNGKMLLFTQYNLGKGVPHLVIDLVEDPEFGEFSIVQGSFPAREASYSPDGFWLVFEAWPAGSNHDIYIMSTNGAMRRQLTNYPFNDFDPAWRPAIH